jgi:hypothetical protein
MARKNSVRSTHLPKRKQSIRLTALRWAVTGLLGLLSIIGGMAALLTFLPRPTVTVHDPVDPFNVMSASFDIAENGFVPLRRVGTALALRQLNLGNTVFEGDPRFGTRFIKPEWRGQTLHMDEHLTVTPSDFFYRAKDGYIAIVVEYQPWFLPFYREKIFPFITHRQTNGRLYWYALPVE